MESINLQGVQIIDHQRMKQTNRLRIALELTEEDSRKFAGVIAIAEMNEVIFNSELKMSEIQGNNNGHEQDIEKVTKAPINERKELTIYEKFRLKCIEYSGETYYEKVKKMLGVEHLKELAQKTDYPSGTEPINLYTILQMQMDFLDGKMYPGVHQVDWSIFSQNLLWHTLFDPINNPPTT